MSEQKLSAADVAALNEIEGAEEMERLKRAAGMLAQSQATRANAQPLETDPESALRTLSGG